MAIDLASSSSPFEFRNMLPLDVLAAVATEKLKDEIHYPGTPKVKTSCFVKRNIKKASTSILTFQEIKCMPVKFLVEKFSEMTSDEYTKKYSYKCMLLPHKCSSTFKSYGNEKKACDEMKSHLRLHIQQLTADNESSKEISNLRFSPKSPKSSSKHPEKIQKKILKQQTPLNGTTPRISPSKIAKKPKSTTFSVKPSKKKFIGNKYIPELSNDSQEESNSDTIADYPPLIERMIDDDFFPSNKKCFLNKRIKKEISKVFDSESESNHYGSYSQHLKIAFFTDVELREDNSGSLSDSDEISFSNDSNSSLEDTSRSSQNSDSCFDKSITFLQDHNYACFERTKNDRLSSTEVKGSSRRYEDPFMYVSPKLPPYVIKTPPFPHIHTPLLPEVAEIIEIKIHDPSDVHTHYVDYSSDINATKSDEESLSDEFTDECDNEDKYPDDFFYKMNNSSGSVLECVENIENKKHSNSCVPKNEVDVNENNENLENVLKDEKELALKFIAKLHTKGKKKVSDSLVCQICPDKSFTAQATLIHHYRSHAGIKPYICKLCSSKFTRQHSLNYHMLIHNNLSRFACDFCGRTFRHPSHYKEHLRRHTGETPYHCTDCSLHFKTRNTFKRHLKTRHGKLLTASGVEDLNTE